MAARSGLRTGRAGVDFPRLASILATGRRVEAPSCYQTGVRLHWFWPYELSSLLRGPESLRKLARFLSHERRGGYDWSFGGPLPHLMQQLHLIFPRRAVWR